MGIFRKTEQQKQAKLARKARRKASRTKAKSLSITPPEGVPLDMEVATLGQRFGAQLVDFFVTMIAAVLFVALVAYGFSGAGNFIAIIAALTFFMARLPYYVLSELAWNGRTLAKRWLGLRVISTDGRSLSAYQIVARNLMKEVEFFAPLTYIFLGAYIHWSVLLIAILWTIVLLIVPWRSKRNQRFGDIIANTAVILDPEPLLLPDISANTPNREEFAFSNAQLDMYGTYELQVLEKVLRAPPPQTSELASKREKSLADIVGRIVKKTNYPEQIQPQKHKAFLQAFYTAQRAYLETKKLYGDARQDKHFREKENEPS